MTDLINRADAIDAVHEYFVDAFNNEPHEIDEDGDDVFTDMKSVNALLRHNKMVSKALKALPSADAVPQLRQTDTLIIADALRYLAKDTERHLVDRTRADALRQQFLKYGASMCKGGAE